MDVFTCNAVLQWVPGHLTLLTSWADWLAPGGWLAFQVPGNFDQPSHTILRDLAHSPRWQSRLRGVQLNRQAVDPGAYLDLLASAGCEVDAWETTYLHVLQGEDAVLDWYRGTGLRPVLAALPEAEAAEFTAEYAAADPGGLPGGTVRHGAAVPAGLRRRPPPVSPARSARRVTGGRGGRRPGRSAGWSPGGTARSRPG